MRAFIGMLAYCTFSSNDVPGWLPTGLTYDGNLFPELWLAAPGWRNGTDIVIPFLDKTILISGSDDSFIDVYELGRMRTAVTFETIQIVTEPPTNAADPQLLGLRLQVWANRDASTGEWVE